MPSAPGSSGCSAPPIRVIGRPRSASHPITPAARPAQRALTSRGTMPPAQRSRYSVAAATSPTPMTSPPDIRVLGVCRAAGCFSTTTTEAPARAAVSAAAAPAAPYPTTTRSASCTWASGDVPAGTADLPGVRGPAGPALLSDRAPPAGPPGWHAVAPALLGRREGGRRQAAVGPQPVHVGVLLPEGADLLGVEVVAH